MMTPKWLGMICIIAALSANACSNFEIVDNAIKKHGAAVYYYQEQDYENARLNCREAIRLWKEIKRLKNTSYPDWSADGHIETCQEILSDIPVPEMSEEMTVVPIKFQKNRIYVTATLNGQESANLLLDTGATTSLLTPEMADRVGIRPASDAKKWKVSLLGDKKVEMPFAKLQGVSIGDATVKNLSVGVYTVDPDKPGINGILGEDFLSHFVVSIDHKSQELKLISK